MSTWLDVSLSGLLRSHARRRLTPAQAVVLGFLSAIAAGTVALRLPLAHAAGTEHGWLTALFTATSAVCVTGLIVVDTGSAWSPFGHVVIALLIKTGGIGILSLGALVALATGRRLGFTDRQRLQAQTNALSVGGIVRFVRSLLLFTTGAELVGALALWPLLMRTHDAASAAWSALFHAVSAFNNAGFSLYPDSLAGYAGDPAIGLLIAGLFVLGGIGLVVVIDVALGVGVVARRRRRQPLTLHTRLALLSTLVLAVAGWVAVAGLEWRNPATLGSLTPLERVVAAGFQALTPRTAGFTMVDIEGYRAPTTLVTMLLMFVGGNPGSTAGGVKTTTIAVLVLTALAASRGRSRVTALGRYLAAATITKAAALAILALLVIGAAATLLTITDPGLPVLDLAFESVSAFGTVGLSLGITSDLTAPGQLMLVVLMFAGRVGLLTVALSLAANGRQWVARYPSEDVVVG